MAREIRKIISEEIFKQEENEKQISSIRVDEYLTGSKHERKI